MCSVACLIWTLVLRSLLARIDYYPTKKLRSVQRVHIKSSIASSCIAHKFFFFGRINIYFLTVLEVGGPRRLRCQQNWFLLKPPPWLADGCLLTVSSYGFSSVYVHPWCLINSESFIQCVFNICYFNYLVQITFVDKYLKREALQNFYQFINLYIFQWMQSPDTWFFLLLVYLLLYRQIVNFTYKMTLRWSIHIPIYLHIVAIPSINEISLTPKFYTVFWNIYCYSYFYLSVNFKDLSFLAFNLI